jgi:Calcium/calmodulin dependent protein kinase II association domain
MFGADAALVAFRLVGSETPKDGTTRPYSAAISLIFQRIRGAWLIVHVHDSSGPAPGSGTQVAKPAPTARGHFFAAAPKKPLDVS